MARNGAGLLRVASWEALDPVCLFDIRVAVCLSSTWLICSPLRESVGGGCCRSVPRPRVCTMDTRTQTAPREIVETVIPVRDCGHCGGAGELYLGTADGVRCGACDGLGRVYVLRRPGEYVTHPHHPEGLLRIASLAGVVDDLGRFTCYVTERAAQIAVLSTPLEAAYWLCPLGLMRVRRG